MSNGKINMNTIESFVTLLDRFKKMYVMISIDMRYMACQLVTKLRLPHHQEFNISTFVFNLFLPIFTNLSYTHIMIIMYLISLGSCGVGTRWGTTADIIVWNLTKMWIILKFSTDACMCLLPTPYFLLFLYYLEGTSSAFNWLRLHLWWNMMLIRGCQED